MVYFMDFYWLRDRHSIQQVIIIEIEKYFSFTRWWWSEDRIVSGFKKAVHTVDHHILIKKTIWLWYQKKYNKMIWKVRSHYVVYNCLQSELYLSFAEYHKGLYLAHCYLLYPWVAYTMNWYLHNRICRGMDKLVGIIIDESNKRFIWLKANK